MIIHRHNFYNYILQGEKFQKNQKITKILANDDSSAFILGANLAYYDQKMLINQDRIENGTLKKQLTNTNKLQEIIY